ncbi:MAG: right-handed parallel beta-helix repeat-containing protein [Thermomicrobiales bacterium]
MDHRLRRLVAAAVLALSLIVVIYLVFFAPSETRISTPTPDTSTQESSGPIWTMLPSTPESDDKRTAEALAVQQEEATPASEDEQGDSPSRQMAEMPLWMGRVASNPENAVCPGPATRTVSVANASELTQALASAVAGDQIELAPGVYQGNFELAASGESSKRIWICGPRDAVIDSGDIREGYGLHITGSYAGVWGITISNAQKGIVVDGGDFVQVDNVEVHTIGDEAIHFRGNATDGVVQDSLIHYTGLRREKFGEGIYVGSAVSNWGEITDGEPDKSDRVAIRRNRIWDTTAESIDLKEGTSNGVVEYNSFDGSGLTEADSWVDVKGNGYRIVGNVGTTSPEDGFQTHNIDDMGWGRENQFVSNTAQVSGEGYGFYIHDADKTANVVSCSNMVTNAGAGFSNIACSDPA